MRDKCCILLIVSSIVCSTAQATAPHFADQYATSGSGTNADPYKGWESALASNTEVVFNKGYYESPVAAITVPSGSVLNGVEGAIVQWPANRSSVNPLFSVPAGNSNIVFHDLQFEAGVTVPSTGVTSQGGSAYISIGTDGSASTVSHVRIDHCRLGVARYPSQGNGGGYQVLVISSVEDLLVQNNTIDAATHNFVFVPGHTTQQYYYRRFVFQNNLVDFSQTQYWFGAVLSIGPDYTATVPALVDQMSIVGNILREQNGGLDSSLGGNDILVASNTTYSDNADEFSGMCPAGGSGTLTNVVYSGNSCRGADPSGDPTKIAVPSCHLKICFATNVTVVGNTLRAPVSLPGIEIVGSKNVNVSGNVVDKAHSASDSYDACFMAGRLSNASFSNNTCLNTGGDVFYIWGDAGEVHDLSFTNNSLFTTAASSIASSFFNFNVTASDVTIRENRVFGKNFASGGAFIKNSGSVTRLNRVGNQEAIQETGWRIGSDEVSDITGSGLQVSSGALAVNAGNGLQISSGALAVNAGAGLQFSSGALVINAGSGIQTAGGTVAIDSTVATLTGAQSLANKTLTSSSNTFPTTSAFSFAYSTSISAQSWFGPNTGLKGASADAVSVPTPGMTAKSLQCKLGTAPGTSKTWTLTAQTGSGNGTTLLSCAVTGSNTTCSTTGGVPWTSGLALSLRATPTSSPAATTVFCSLGVSPEESFQ